MLLTARASKQGCSTIYRSAHKWRNLARPLSIAISPTASPDAIDQTRVAQKPIPIRHPNASTRSHSQLSSKTDEGQKALKLLKNGKVEAVAGLLSDAVAREGGEHLVVELARGVLASRKGKSNSIDLFFRVLETLPNANQANSSSFQGLLDILENHESGEEFEMIKRLGILCASKGYSDFVTSQIAPIVSGTCSKLDFAHWQREVNLALTAFKGPVIDVDKVFEDDGQDYESVEAESPRVTEQSRSVLQLVERTLPSLLPEPSVATPVFEDLSAEYAVAGSLAKGVKSQNTIQVLESLVLDSELQAAYELLQELKEVGISIPPSIAYADAALLVLDALQIQMEEKALYNAMEAQALTWLRLVPDSHTLDGVPAQVMQILNLVGNSPRIPLSLVMKVALLFASKGYAPKVTEFVFRNIFLHAPPGSAELFLEEFESTHEKYNRAHAPDFAAHRTRHIKVHGRGKAVRCLAQLGHFDRALALFSDLSVDNWYLTPPVHNFILKRLHRWNDPKAAQYIDEVSRRKKQMLTYRGLANDTIEAFETPSAKELPPPLPSDLIASLRALNTMANSPQLPHTPTMLLNFIAHYLSTRHTLGLTIILNKALHRNLAFASNLLTAEMLFYYRHRRPIHVIKTFVDHFYLVGVPLERVLELSKLEYELGVGSGESWPQPGREGLQMPVRRFHEFSNLSSPKNWHSVKLWPAPEQCSLVWHALASLSKGRKDVPRRYDQLRCVAADRRHQSPEVDEEEEQRKPLDLSFFANPANGWAFAPFIRKLSRSKGGDAAAKVLSDLVELGFEPTVVHMTEVAGAYARMGDEQKALMILTKLEQLNDSQDAVSEEHSEGISTQVESRRTAPLTGPDAAMYKSLFCGFIESRKFGSAEEVDRRFRSRFDVQLGEDPVYDAAYVGLEAHKEMEFQDEQQQAGELQEEEHLEDEIIEGETDLERAARNSPVFLKSLK